ncbi:MAG: hypothetical protein E7277_02675 [Lachnospiraceae bacterium]|nr:hypothetical protein [Lachnospiraceae bacterium]
MIYWISGPYGVGKSTVAKCLQELLPKAFVYDADWQTIHDRILKRGKKEDCWCMQNIGMCLEYQQKETHAIHVNALNRSPEEIAREIAES